jgi:hypothetical protein
MADYNLTADGSTAALQFQGEGSVNATGTFGGGTLSIEASFDGGTTWVAQTDGEFTTAGTLNIKIGPCYLRTTLAGATTPDIDVNIVGNDVRKSTRID